MSTAQDAPTDPDQLLRLATVKSVDLSAARCTLLLDDGDDGEVETGPLAWVESRLGKTRVWSPPSVDEQVLLICPGGEIGAGIVLRGLPSTANPPAGNSLREVILFEDGAEIAYDPEAHELEVILPAGATAALVADGGITITGDITLTGKLTASDDVIAGGKSLKSHKHSGVQAGAAQTGTPV
jgi:phage baseplate assembly protein V